MEIQLNALSEQADKDLESGGASYSTLNVGNGRSLRLRRRKDETARSISRLGPIAKHAKLAKAVDSLDRFFLTMGNLLRNEPWARLAFISYIMLLHLWVLYILEFHTNEAATRSVGSRLTPGEVILPPGMSSSLQPQN